MNTQIKKLEMELLHNFVEDTRVIPDFISGRKFTHKKCFDISQDIFFYIKDLYRADILSDNEVKKIYFTVISCINEMLDIEPKVGLEYYRFIFDMCVFYREQAIENELYEIAENLNKFNELNIKNKY
jgi:SNF2 family DNA or RNA helicase